MTVTIEQLFNGILRSTLEKDSPTLLCTSLTAVELDAISRKDFPMDIDHLAIHERCNVLFKKPELERLFGDSSCVFYQAPKKEKIYSSILKEVLTIGKIGAYKFSIKSAARSQTTDEHDSNLNDLVVDPHTQDEFESEEKTDDENGSNGNDYTEFEVRSPNTTPLGLASSTSASSVNDTDSSSEDDESVDQGSNSFNQDPIFGTAQKILKNLQRNYPNYISFNLFATLILEAFTDSHVVIWKYGQKVPLNTMLPILESLIEDAKLPVEIAVGIQFNIPNQFVSAEVKQGLYSCSYSNFLSNRMCNICITDPKVARKYRPECYRLCVYNTFQHVKKALDFVLLRDASVRETTLKAFKKSFDRLMKNYKKAIKKVKNGALRLETYLVVRNMKQLKEYTDSMKSLFQSFTYVAIPHDVLKRRLIQHKKILEDLFDYFLNCNGIEAFLFFLYYEKFQYFMNSTTRISKRFLDSNLGLAVADRYIDRTNGLPTRIFFDEMSLNEIYFILQQIFTDEASRRPHLMYFFLCFYVHFKSRIDAESALLAVVLRYTLELIFTRTPRKCNVPHTYLPVETIEVSEMHDLFAIMYATNLFLSKCVKIQKEFSVGDVFNLKLQQYLVYVNFSFVYNQKHYEIGIPEIDDSTQIHWRFVVKFMECTTYEKFIWILRNNDKPLSVEDYRIWKIGENIFKSYKVKHAYWKSFFYPIDSGFRPPKFDVKIEEIMSFIFMTFPKVYNELDSGLMMCTFFYKNFDQFSKFIFAALVKYHTGDIRPPMSLIKYMENTICFRHLKEENRTQYTFNRILFFSGRFDICGHPSEISLPLPKKVVLKAKLDSRPYPHLKKNSIDSLTVSVNQSRNREAEFIELIDQIYPIVQEDTSSDTEDETDVDLERAPKHSLQLTEERNRNKINRPNNNCEINSLVIQRPQSAIPEDNAETATSDQHESRTGNENSLGGGFDEFQQGDTSSNSFPVNDSLNCSSFSGLSDASFSGSSDTFSNASSYTYSSASSNASSENSSGESSNASSNGSSDTFPQNDFRYSQASDSVEYSSESFNSSNNSMNCSQTSDSFDYSSSSSNGSYSPSSSNESFKYAPLNDSFYSPMNDSISSSSGDETSDAYLQNETYYTPLIVKSKSARPIVKSRNVTPIHESKKRFTRVQSGSVTPIVKSSRRSAVVQSRRRFIPVIESRKKDTLAAQSKNFASMAQPRMNFTALDDFENFPSPFAEPKRNVTSIAQFKRSFTPVSQFKNVTSVVPSRNIANSVVPSRNITPTVQSEWNIMPIRQSKRSTNQSKWNTVPKEINSNSTPSNEEGLLFNPTIIFGIVFVVIVFQLISFFFRWITIVFFNSY